MSSFIGFNSGLLKVGILLSATFFLLHFYSCKAEVKSEKDEEARELFRQSAELLNEATQKISIAKDSMEIDSLSLNYEKRITDINFSFPPKTDYKLTEQENDSLFKLIKILQDVKKLKLEDLHKAYQDTINTGL